MDWFYDVLKFCNYVDTLYDIGSWEDDYKMLKGHCEDIIEGENKYSSNEIANAYILKKCRGMLNLISHGDTGYNIRSYISSMRNEWADIVYCYNWVKYDRGE